MADMMTFSNTVEEFMEQYKITDTEEIYTNGAELVPIFRMNQWFDHMESEWETGYTLPDGAYWKCKRCGKLSKVVALQMDYCGRCGAHMKR